MKQQNKTNAIPPPNKLTAHDKENAYEQKRPP
jgi:hypothetical protein